MEGLLLDVAYEEVGSLTITIANGKGLDRTRLSPVTFSLYVIPRSGRIREIENLAGEAGEVAVEEWLEPPWYERVRRVVKIMSGDLGFLERVRLSLERAGVARVVNSFPSLLTVGLWDNGVCPGTLVEYDSGSVRATENVDDPLYPNPPLRIALVEAYAWHGSIVLWEKVDYYLLRCCNKTLRVEDPVELIDHLEEWKPHIVSARPVVRWRLPLEGRVSWLWFDPQSNLVDPLGLVEWMRVSCLPYSEVHGAPIGKILTSAEAREAYRRKYILDPQAPRVEPLRPVSSLKRADLAGASRIPVSGLYWNVYQLDFHSLYPNIISKYNISSETVNSPECNHRHVIPDINHSICMDRRGLVPAVLSRLVERRSIIKRHMREMPWLKGRDEALKWILVSGFGYLGYRNSLFGSISAYECVTWFARNILRRAEDIAERNGYRIIHSIVDSIIVQPVKPKHGIEELKSIIESETGIPLKLEAEYIWLFIPKTNRGIGAGNKYYGLTRDGKLKIRGIAVRRRNTPPFIARLQLASLQLMARAVCEHEMVKTYDLIAEIWSRALNSLLANKIPLDMLVINEKNNKYIVWKGRWHPVWEGVPQGYDTYYYLERALQALRELPEPIHEKVMIKLKMIREQSL
jgi:DNA polymerase I